VKGGGSGGNGGNGFNLLIAGATATTLTGGSGNDILIGGTTRYDTDQATLTAILAEWVANHDTPLLDATTVLSNAAANQLTGGAGHDVFFARLAEELLDFDPNRDTWVQLASPARAKKRRPATAFCATETCNSSRTVYPGTSAYGATSWGWETCCIFGRRASLDRPVHGPNNLGTFTDDVLTVIAWNHTSTSNDGVFT
jgi:hypothetical protein